MGTFHVGCKLENHTDRKQSIAVSRALVDTGSEYTWIPTKILEKIGVNRNEVVFSEPGDLTLLGARSLEGLSLASGPLLAA